MKQIIIRLMLLASAVLMVGNLQAKKVHTIGDSTMANYDESSTNTRGWGMYFGNFLPKGWSCVNYAKGGRDSRAGYNELWQNAKNNVQPGDYVLIQFSHNDEKYNGMDNLELQAHYTAKGDAANAAAVKSDGRGTIPSTTYKQCLKQIIDEVKAKGATPILVSAVCRCYFSGATITRAGRHDLGDKYDAIVDGTIKTGLKVAANDHTMDYSYQMQQLAAEENVAFIDMTTATKSLYESYGNYDKCYAALFDKGGEKDNTHYNQTGAQTAASLCAQLLKEQGLLPDNNDDDTTTTDGSPVSITYRLDKGGLNQADDAIITPNDLNAAFAGMTWTAGSSLTVENTKSYRGATGEANIPQTRIYNGTDGSFSSSAGVDNTLTLTLFPEDGFTFIPTKLSFQAARYGTDGGTITASVNAGDIDEDLVVNAGVNRDGKGLTIASFSKEITSVKATADKPLKVNFSFLGLGKTKEMGLSNVIIEGILVGAASQVTKHALTTQVLPSAEAGSITRTPDLQQYKEGTVVTLKATKNFGYRFKHWQDATGAIVSTEAETTVTMASETTLQAVFEPVPVYTVTTDATTTAADGFAVSITLTPNDHNARYEAGTKITATANESKILKFLSWTDDNENNNASTVRELTVNGDMTLVANYEVQDFVAVFDASTTADYAYRTTEGYPFRADVAWDSERNAKSCVVKVSDGSLCYSQDGGTPVVRNRQSVVLSTINGLYQNGYRSTDIAFQYQFSTKGFTRVTFVADMAAKNMANKNWKALISTDGTTYAPLGQSWAMTANVQTPLSFELPADAIGKDLVYIRITGEGTELLSDKYPFDKQFDGLDYSSNSECGVGNVYVLGEAEVIPDAEAPVVTATAPADKATGVSATGRITISFNERIQSASSDAPAALTAADGSPVSITPFWSARSVSFDYSALSYNTAYTFTLPANYVQDRSGNKMDQPVTITFTTMQRPAIAKAAYDFIVPDNGTITEALAAANNRPDKTSRYRVFIRNGHYTFDTNGTTTGGDGKTYPDPRSYLKAPNTSFIGESMEGVVITNQTPAATWDNGFGAACPLEGIGNGDVLIIESSATNSYFQNLTIKTSMGDAHGRDIALHDRSNRTIFKDACLWGYQDTYVSNNQNGKFYFEGGVIRGRTDFLCGKGDLYCNKVTLRQVAGGYLAVPSVPKKYGYIFQSCKIVPDGSASGMTYTLGRPWGKGTPIALFIDTEMEVVPSPIGWNEMSGGYPKRFAEYGSHTSKGAPVDLSSRKTTFGDGYPNNPILTADEAAQYTLDAVMGQDDQWQPTLLTEQAPVPTNVVINDGTLTWDDSNYALLWAICKDGQVIAFTTVPTYPVTESGTYTVRAANEMGGLSAPSDAATATTAINDASTKATGQASGIYALDGKRLNRLQNGLNIVRLTDGTVKKAVVKPVH